MKKQKPLAERMPVWQFIALMMAIYGIVSGVTLFLFSVIFLQGWIGVIFEGSFLFSVAVWVAITAGQAWLFKKQFGWNMRRWLSFSIVGIIIMQTLLAITVGNALPLTLNIAGIFSGLGGLALAQFMALRRYVRHRWLWIMALYVSGFIEYPLFSLMNSNLPFGNESFLTSIWSIPTGMLMGLFMAVMMTLIVRLSMRTPETDAHMSHDADAFAERQLRLQEKLEESNKFQEQVMAASQTQQLR